MKKKANAILVFVCFLITPNCGPISDSNSVFDAKFGDSGKVLTDFFGGNDSISALAEQSDHKIIAVGYATQEDKKSIAIARYLADGTLDLTFDNDGKVTYEFNNQSEAVAVAVDSSNRILVLGNCYTNSTSEIVLLRFTPSGVLDTSFDSDGFVRWTISGSRLTAGAILITTDNKILIGGGNWNFTAPAFLLARLTSTGAFDVSFSGDGIATAVMSADEQRIQSLAIDSNGRILAGGFGRVGPIGDFALARFSSNGELDTSFGISGKRLIDFSNGLTTSNDSLYALSLEANNKILAIGKVNDSIQSLFAFARLNDSGNLDTTFGDNGKKTTPFEMNGSTYSIDTNAAVKAGEGIYYNIGSVSLNGNSDLTLSSFDSELNLQTLFGINGTYSLDFFYGNDVGRSVAYLNQKVVVAGHSERPTTGLDFILLRLK